MSVEWIENLKVGDKCYIQFGGLSGSVREVSVTGFTKNFIRVGADSMQFRRSDGHMAGDRYMSKLVPITDRGAKNVLIRREACDLYYRLRVVEKAPAHMQEEFIDFAKDFVPRLEASKKGRE